MFKVFIVVSALMAELWLKLSCEQNCAYKALHRLGKASETQNKGKGERKPQVFEFNVIIFDGRNTLAMILNHVWGEGGLVV